MKACQKRKGLKALMPKARKFYLSTWKELDVKEYKLPRQYLQVKRGEKKRELNTTPKIKRNKKTKPKSSLKRSVQKRFRGMFNSSSLRREGKNVMNDMPAKAVQEDYENLIQTTVYTPIKSSPEDNPSSQEEELFESEYSSESSESTTDSILISRSEYEDLLNVKRLYERIIHSNLLTGGRFSSSFEGREFLAHIAGLAPQQSLESLELTLGLFTNYILYELNIDVSPEQISRTTPSTNTLREIIKNGATSSIFLFSEQILNDGDSLLHMACDKGGGRFIKVINRWDPIRKRIVSFTIDTDNCEETSEECARGVEFSIRRLQAGTTNENDLKKLVLYGCTTDSGGGGTGHSFKDALLKKQNVTCQEEEYLIGFCVMHILQLTLSTPMKSLMGEGGLGLRNLLQLLHSLYDFECKHEPKEWLILVNEALKDLGKVPIKAWAKSVAPILTRWGSVGKGAEVLCDEEKMTIYKQVAENVVDGSASRSATYKIGSSILSLMKEPLIMSDAHLANGFMNYFFNDNYSWLEKGDEELGNTLGFMSRHMLVRYFLMIEKLQKGLNNGWKNMDEFKTFCEFRNLTAAEKEKQVGKANDFFQLAIEPLEKHYEIWANDLLFFCLFSEFEIASCLAKVLIEVDRSEQSNGPNSVSNTTVFQSKVHKPPIDLSAFRRFILKNCKDLKKIKDGFHIKKLAGLVNELKSGIDMWSPSY